MAPVAPSSGSALSPSCAAGPASALSVRMLLTLMLAVLAVAGRAGAQQAAGPPAARASPPPAAAAIATSSVVFNYASRADREVYRNTFPRCTGLSCGRLTFLTDDQAGLEPRVLDLPTIPGALHLHAATAIDAASLGCAARARPSARPVAPATTASPNAAAFPFPDTSFDVCQPCPNGTLSDGWQCIPCGAIVLSSGATPPAPGGHPLTSTTYHPAAYGPFYMVAWAFVVFSLIFSSLQFSTIDVIRHVNRGRGLIQSRVSYAPLLLATLVLMGGVGLATWATLHLIFPDRLLDVLLTGPSHQELPLSLRMATLFAAATCTPAAGFQTTPIYGAARPLAARDFYSFLLGLLSTDCPRDDAFPFSTLPPVITILSWFITVALCVFVVAAARLYQRWRLRLSVKSSSRDWSTLPDVVCQIATNTALRSVFYLGALLFVQIIFSGPLYFSLPYILMIYGFSFTVIRTVAYIVESNPYSNIEWVGSVFVEHAIFCNRALLMMVGFWGVATSRGFIGLAPYLSSELHAVILGKSAIVWMCLSLVLSPLLAIAPNILRLILVGEV